MNKYRSSSINTKRVILKPIGLSRGRGICIIRKMNDSYRIDDYRRKDPKLITLKDNMGLEKFFSENKGFFNRYLIQTLPGKG